MTESPTSFIPHETRFKCLVILGQGPSWCAGVDVGEHKPEMVEKQFSAAEENPDVKAIVFQGAGKAFVAGADIRYFIQKIKSGNIPELAAFTRKGHDLLLRIETSPKLTITLLDGLSMGGDFFHRRCVGRTFIARTKTTGIQGVLMIE